MKTESCAKSIQKLKTNGGLEIEEKHKKKKISKTKMIQKNGRRSKIQTWIRYQRSSSKKKRNFTARQQYDVPRTLFMEYLLPKEALVNK